MSISIQNDAGAEGGGDVVNAGTVQVNMIQIITLNGTVNDTAFVVDPAVGDLIKVEYVQPATNTTAPATRLNTLINTDFKVSAGNPDIIIVGAGPNFTLLDGTVMCGNGVTIGPKSPDNPTGSIYVIYDTTDGNGGGIQVPKQGGGGTVPTPDPVVLYHELSHAFRLADTFLGSGPQPQPDDEVAAIQDENVLRPLLGIGLRDPNPPHTGSAPSCGGPPGHNCCIVATVASGSSYSAEVSALRTFRDSVLRDSEIGFDFFARLHEDYYGFSPQVCKLMAQSPLVFDRVSEFFVSPLVRVLKLLQRYATDQVDEMTLAAEFIQGLDESRLRTLSFDEITQGLATLEAIGESETLLPGVLAQFAGVLEESARTSPYIRWALLDPIGIYARTLQWRLAGMEAAELGSRLAAEFDAWSARLPITNRWDTLSNYALAQELRLLNSVLFRHPAARLEAGQRMAERFAGKPDHRATLRAAGFVEDDIRTLKG